LIPHFVVFLFLWSFGNWILSRPKEGGVDYELAHTGLRNLLVIIAYIYIVWSGWYGSWIVPIVNAWFVLILFTAFIWFIFTRTIPIAKIGRSIAGLHSLGGEIGKKLRERELLEEKLEYWNNLLRSAGVEITKKNWYEEELKLEEIRENEEVFKTVMKILEERNRILRKLKKLR
jgi:hypothetical protein